MKCEDSVFQIEIVNKDRLLLGIWDRLELVDVSQMKVVDSFQIDLLAFQIMRLDDTYLIATDRGVVKV